MERKMKQKCTVKLTDTQIQDGEKQCVEITTQGSFFWNKGRWLLRFEEFFDEDIRSETTVSAKSEECVSIIHNGDITTELTVETGKRHNSHYVTPYGELMIGIDAIEIDNRVTEYGGTLRLVYSIDYYAAVAAVKEINIEITL